MRNLIFLSGMRTSGPVLLGEYFPRHLQVAYGRGVFKLLHFPGANYPGLNYLRDLPLNMATLAAQGWPHALAAYRAECERTGEEPVV